MALLAAVGLFRTRSSLVVASIAYVGASLGALSLHEYLLGRSLVPIAVAIAIPAALGLAELLALRPPQGPWKHR